MSAATELDRALSRFAPDVADAMRIGELVDRAASSALAADAAREAYGIGRPPARARDEGEEDLVEQQDFAHGRLHGLSDAFAVLVGSDPQTLRADALARAVDRRATARRGLELVVVGADGPGGRRCEENDPPGRSLSNTDNAGSAPHVDGRRAPGERWKLP